MDGLPSANFYEKKESCNTEFKLNLVNMDGMTEIYLRVYVKYNFPCADL
jgi:hypothetical protein